VPLPVIKVETLAVCFKLSHSNTSQSSLSVTGQCCISTPRREYGAYSFRYFSSVSLAFVRSHPDYMKQHLSILLCTLLHAASPAEPSIIHRWYKSRASISSCRGTINLFGHIWGYLAIDGLLEHGEQWNLVRFLDVSSTYLLLG
jgi:hypothetical protein